LFIKFIDDFIKKEKKNLIKSKQKITIKYNIYNVDVLKMFGQKFVENNKDKYKILLLSLFENVSLLKLIPIYQNRI
jgi:hypothetical protein